MKTLDFSNIISYVKKGEKAENEFQAVLKYKGPDGAIYEPHNELREYFYFSLYFPTNYNRQKIFSFLDYHLNKFEGDKIDFIDFLRKEIQPKRIQVFSTYKYHDTNIEPVNEIIYDWFEIQKVEKNLPQYINLPDDKSKVLFAKKLKNEFKTETGLDIRFMIEALKQLDLLILGNTPNLGLYTALKKYFNRDIGTYNGIFNHKIRLPEKGCKDDIIEINKAHKRIEIILDQIKEGK